MSEATFGSTLLLTQTPSEAQRLPQVNSPKSPPTGSHPPTADGLKIQSSLARLHGGTLGKCVIYMGERLVYMGERSENV